MWQNSLLIAFFRQGELFFPRRENAIKKFYEGGGIIGKEELEHGRDPMDVDWSARRDDTLDEHNNVDKVRLDVTQQSVDHFD